MHLDALINNLKVVRRILKNQKTEVLAIVKADAYGHGMVPVAKALQKGGVNFFGVATLDEAMALRKALPAARILVLGSCHRSQVRLFIRHRITPTVSSAEDARFFEEAAPENGRFPVHVKIDTGMGRLGVWHEHAEDFVLEIARMENITVEGLYTHFSRADHSEKIHTLDQLDCFEKVIARLEARGVRARYRHAANSLGVIRFKKSHLNLVRPGIILYGLRPSDEKLPRGIRPILSLKTRIAFLKDAGKGRVLSYGATHRVSRPTRIATLPVGYSHGYRWALSNKSHVIVRGRACPVVGRVTMDQTLVDVGALPSAKRWDEVTLIGQDGAIRVLAEDLARWIGTIPYEIVCGLSSRIPRIYKRFTRNESKRSRAGCHRVYNSLE
ncbi:MAG: alanine racemase [Candidatus Omnitrophica bacterium]|nr:alanine racemase [Candidatus Omnitrophota bacterium]